MTPKKRGRPAKAVNVVVADDVDKEKEEEMMMEDVESEDGGCHEVYDVSNL